MCMCAAPAPEHKGTAPAGLRGKLLQQAGLAHAGLAADEYHPSPAVITPRELLTQVTKHRLSADERLPLGRLRQRRPWRIGVLVNRDGGGRAGWYPTRQDVVVEQHRLVLGGQVKLLPQGGFATMKLPDRLVGRAHLRVQAHEVAVDLFPCRVLLEDLPEAVGRLVEGAASLEFVREREQHPEVQFGQIVTALGAPVLIPILRKEFTAVDRERGLKSGDLLTPQSILGELLKPIRIDRDMLRVQDEHGVLQPEEGGVLSPR